MDAHTRWKSALATAASRERYSSYVRAWDARIGSFLQFDPEPRRDDRPAAPQRAGEAAADGPLAGLPFAVKDNIAVEGFRLTCGSRMLAQLEAPYTATAVRRLQEAGAVVVGKTNLDEFGMGSSTDNSALARTSNPWDVERVAGGSSGGSAAAVAAGLVPFALGSDTGGSIRQPAAFCGVYGLKPTYGAVSRFGLVAYASSLEGIGVVAESVAIVRAAFDAMRGIDPLDHSSLDSARTGTRAADGPAARGRASTDAATRGRASGGEPIGGVQTRLGVVAKLSELSPEVDRAYRNAIAVARELGLTVTEIELPSLEYVVPAYYTIATAEASANLARFTGIRYGYRPPDAENPDELVRRARSTGFGDEVKLRILLGTYVLRSGFQDQYYVRAQKVRTAIRNDLAAAFEAVDALLMPVYPTQAFRHGNEELSPFQQKLADKFTATANLAGVPALTIPAGVERGLPVGLQLLAPPFAEERLFALAERFAERFPVEHPERYSAEWSS